MLEDLAAASWRPKDRLWFFFSGYGVNYNGQDFLMPVEGNPEKVLETGIEVRGLFQSLQLANLDVLVLLDINRAVARLGDAPIGQEIIELAQELNIPTIVSCQAEQFSHESKELRHGFFTAALLEALRSGNGNTLAQLERYLSVRTPQLCQDYWRPTQNPVTIMPSGDRVILGQSVANTEKNKTPTVASNEPLASTASSPISNSSAETEKAKAENPPPNLPSLPAASTKNPPRQKTTNISSRQQLLLWGGSTILVVSLMVFVLLRYRGELGEKKFFPVSGSNTTADTKIVTMPHTSRDTTIIETLPDMPSTPPTLTAKSTIFTNSLHRQQALSELAKMSLKPNQASDLQRAIATAKKIKPDNPRYNQAQENIQTWSSMIFSLAQNRAKRIDYTNAIAAASLITDQEAPYQKAQAAIKQWRVEAKQYVSNTTLLEAANNLIKPGQASSYNRAIDVAEKVPSDQPGFNVAQQLINKWSQQMLRIAKQRANKGDFKSAIETATLIPEGTSTYSEAKKSIQQWQKN